jgi:hypothetical protein
MQRRFSRCGRDGNRVAANEQAHCFGSASRVLVCLTIALDVPVLALGETPYGGRRIARFAGGSFDGPRLRGKVLPGGGGWILLRRDDVTPFKRHCISPQAISLRNKLTAASRASRSVEAASA